MSYYQNGERIFEEGEELVEPAHLAARSSFITVEPPDSRRFQEFARRLLRRPQTEVSHYLRRLHHE